MPIFNAFTTTQQLPAGAGAWMSTRAGGFSAAPWDQLNLGDHVGDVPSAVQANRHLLARSLGARPVFLKQVHGTGVAEILSSTGDGLQADACFTFTPGLACTIMVADCLPVLMWDQRGLWVAAAHAGWRGLAGERGTGVLEALWAALLARGARAEHTRVWLGPCIGPDAFEVGPEVREAFDPRQPQVAAAFRGPSGDRWRADLASLARHRLQKLGLIGIDGNDGTGQWCTVSNPGLFFSHRRDAVRWGSSGRMAACIWLG